MIKLNVPPEQLKRIIKQEKAKGKSSLQILLDLEKREIISGIQPEFGIKRTASREALPTALGIGGSIAGEYLFGPPGAIILSGVGGGVGELLQEEIEKAKGLRKEIRPGQVIATGVASSALEGGGRVAFKVGSKALTALRPKMIKLLKHLSGYPQEVVERALKRTPGVLETIKGGEEALTDILKRSALKLNKLANESVKEARQTVKTLAKKAVVNKDEAVKEAEKLINRQKDVFRTRHNIGITKKGKLLFTRPNAPSRIISKAQQSALQEAFNWFNSLKKKYSLGHFNAVLERIIALSKKTPAGEPTGLETKKIINEMINEAGKFAKRVYPKEYAEFLEKNLKKRIGIINMQDILGLSARPSPLELSRSSVKVLQVFNSGRLPIRQTLEQTGKEIGEDIVGAAAGSLIKRGEQVSARAPNLTRRDVLTKIVEFIPREMVKGYIEAGKLVTPTAKKIVRFFVPPLAKQIDVIAKGLKISAKALRNEIANLLLKKK